MPKLFEKAAVYTDIHFGLRHNSKEHNEDCIEFLIWFSEQAKKDLPKPVFLWVISITIEVQ